MAAIADIFKRGIDFVMDNFRDDGDDLFGRMNSPEGDYDEDDYTYAQEGSAVRIIEPDYEPVQTRRSESNVINHPNANRGANEVIVVEPRSFDDVALIVQHLKDKKIVMLNLHLLVKEQVQRTIDYVYGACQALNYTPKEVGNMVFAFVPGNVNISLSADTNSQQSKFNDSLWRTSLQ